MSQWWEAPSHCTHSMEATDAPAESCFPRTSADTSAGAPDELPPRKVDELSPATGIVRHNLSITIAGAESCQSRNLSSMTQNPVIPTVVKALFFY
jgi:hypothetical protein